MKKLLVIMLLIPCFLLSGCFSHIEDTNGDDISLTRITDEDILSNSYRNISMFSSRTEVGNQVKLKIEKFSGIEEVVKITTKDSQKISISSTLESGNLRIVILKDDSIYTDVKVGGEKTYTLSSGSYRIIIAGESAKLELIVKK